MDYREKSEKYPDLGSGKGFYFRILRQSPVESLALVFQGRAHLNRIKAVMQGQTQIFFSDT